MIKTFWFAFGLLARVITPVSSYCDDPSPAFPLPHLDSHPEELKAVKESLSQAIKNLTSMEQFNATSFSFEVTSSTKTLFSVYHTADVRSKEFPGTSEVDGSSLYRIASMTKPFTVLAILQQHAAGTLHIDDPINKYIPGLNGPHNGSIPWHDITIRAMASQISGIPRDIAQQDLVSTPQRAIDFGLPPESPDKIPQCDSIVNYTRSCTAQDLTNWVKTLRPLFAPNQKSSYSNMNFDLLGLVIENVTGMPYGEYVQTKILDHLDMDVSTFDTPPESSVVIPAGIEFYWSFDMGIQKATGGLYSSTDDLSKFIRYALTHYNALTPVVNWFQPTSWSNSLQSFYGMPWETFRTNSYLPHSTRPITLITKGGGLPGYTSIMIMIPEYGFGMSILIAGNGKMLGLIGEVVVPAMVKYADAIAQKTLERRYAGIYAAPESSSLNSSVTLGFTPDHGLVLESLVSNGTDTLSALVVALLQRQGSVDDYIFYVTPTLLYQDEEQQQGERWRILPMAEAKKSDIPGTGVWNNFCETDIDFLSYAGLPVNEIMFWGGDESKAEPAKQAELTGFRVVLDKLDAKKTAVEESIDEL